MFYGNDKKPFFKKNYDFKFCCPEWLSYKVKLPLGTSVFMCTVYVVIIQIMRKLHQMKPSIALYGLMDVLLLLHAVVNKGDCFCD